MLTSPAGWEGGMYPRNLEKSVLSDGRVVDTVQMKALRKAVYRLDIGRQIRLINPEHPLEATNKVTYLTEGIKKMRKSWDAIAQQMNRTFRRDSMFRKINLGDPVNDVEFDPLAAYREWADTYADDFLRFYDSLRQRLKTHAIRNDYTEYDMTMQGSRSLFCRAAGFAAAGVLMAFFKHEKDVRVDSPEYDKKVEALKKRMEKQAVNLLNTLGIDANWEEKYVEFLSNLVDDEDFHTNPRHPYAGLMGNFLAQIRLKYVYEGGANVMGKWIKAFNIMTASMYGSGALDTSSGNTLVTYVMMAYVASLLPPCTLR